MDSRKSGKNKTPDHVCTSSAPESPGASAQHTVSFKKSHQEEADPELLGQPENHLYCTEKKPGKKEQRKEKSKNCKRARTDKESSSEIFKFPECVPRKREKKRQKDSLGYPSKRKCRVHDVCATSAPVWSPIIMKKSKSRKIKARGTDQKALLTEMDQCFQGPAGAPKLRKLREEKPPLADEHSSEDAGEGCAGSTLKAVPNYTHGRQPDGTAQSNMEDKVSDASLERSPKLEEICGASDHSQDLFITQTAFLPGRGSGHSSSESPPLGQEQLARGRNSFRNGGRTDVIQLYSQISAFTVMEKHEPDDSQHRSATLSNKATQTDNVFSYLSLISVLNKIKALETCSEKPIDLCLPKRVRAGKSQEGTQENGDDVILLSVAPPAKSAAAAEGTERLTFSQLRRFDGRLVQTLLNSSYFFKGKEDSKDSIHITPLLKQKRETKKRKRKAVGLRCKKETLKSRDNA